MSRYVTTIDSPVGPLALTGADEVDGARLALTGLHFGAAEVEMPGPFEAVVAQLKEFFDGDRTDFDLSLAPSGTDFQQRVWTELRAIPYGETRSYGQVAAAIGAPTAVRAVGAANGRNPLAIVVPCHRVIGASGSLTGFAGGLAAKRWLLAHERSRVADATALF